MSRPGSASSKFPSKMAMPVRLPRTWRSPPAAKPCSVPKSMRMLGLFSHLSLFLGGILVPIIFWATNKDKSKFVTFHSLQALWFHIAYIFVIVFAVMILVIGGIGFGFLTTGFQHGSKNAGGAIFVIALIAFYGFLFLSIFGAMAY